MLIGCDMSVAIIVRFSVCFNIERFLSFRSSPKEKKSATPRTMGERDVPRR